MENKDRNAFAADSLNLKQSTKRFANERFSRLVAERRLSAGAVDRPGFDLGGSTGNTIAGTGIGLGDDAGESRMDRSIPGRRITGTLSIPRWRGPDIEGNPPEKR